MRNNSQVPRLSWASDQLAISQRIQSGDDRNQWLAEDERLAVDERIAVILLDEGEEAVAGIGDPGRDAGWDYKIQPRRHHR